MEIGIWLSDHEAQAHQQVNARSSVFLNRLPRNNLSTWLAPDLANRSEVTSANLNTLSSNPDTIRKIPVRPYTIMLNPGRAGRRHHARCPACKTRRVLVPSWSQSRLDQNSLIFLLLLFSFSMQHLQCCKMEGECWGQGNIKLNYHWVHRELIWPPSQL